MQNAAARSHPLHVARCERSNVAEAVAMLNSSRKHIRYGDDAAMWMPWEPSEIIGRYIVPEIIEEQKRVKFVGFAKAKCAAQLDSCSLNCWRGLDDFLDSADRH